MLLNTPPNRAIVPLCVSRPSGPIVPFFLPDAAAVPFSLAQRAQPLSAQLSHPPVVRLLPPSSSSLSLSPLPFLELNKHETLRAYRYLYLEYFTHTTRGDQFGCHARQARASTFARRHHCTVGSSMRTSQVSIMTKGPEASNAYTDSPSPR